MQYRTFGKLDWKASALGFGCMRLPQRRLNRLRAETGESIRIIRHGIDLGINYIDTADVYGAGASERIIGRWLARTDDIDDRIVAVGDLGPERRVGGDRGHVGEVGGNAAGGAAVRSGLANGKVTDGGVTIRHQRIYHGNIAEVHVAAVGHRDGERLLLREGA